MLIIMQLINRMRYLEYTNNEIETVFQDIIANELDFDNLCDVLNIEPLNISQHDRAMHSLPKYKSALEVSKVFKVS